MERGKRRLVALDDSSCFDIDKVSQKLDEIMPKIFNKEEPKIVTDIYFHREKEDNWDLESQAEKLGFKAPHDMVYIGAEVGMKVEITDNHTKVLEIEGIDVSDKNIFI